MVDFILNGAPVSVRADHPHLLAALREELDVTSAKDGCSPQGQCGCCTVMIDGKVQISCTYATEKVAGRSVTTLEGVDQAERTKFSDAFASCGGLQCGFCIPGIVMRAMAQVDKTGAGLERADMARHLGAHLCRCTGYVKVLDAIEAVAKGKSADMSLPGLISLIASMRRPSNAACDSCDSFSGSETDRQSHTAPWGPSSLHGLDNIRDHLPRSVVSSVGSGGDS